MSTDSPRGASEQTFVIANYNGVNYLANCIKSIINQSTPPQEIIVVDNGSTDGSIEMVSRIFPEIVVCRLGDNLGLTAAYNAGLERARNDWIVLANNDIVLDPNCLKLLRDAVVDSMTIAVPQFISINAPHKPQTFPVRFVPSIRHPWSSAIVRPVPARSCLSDIAPFGLLMVNRRSIPRIDDTFPYYFNEDDFSLVCRRKGTKIVFVRSAIVLHYGSATLGKVNLRKIRLFLNGWTRFRAKWMSPWLLVPSIYFAVVIQSYEHLVRVLFTRSVLIDAQMPMG